MAAALPDKSVVVYLEIWEGLNIARVSQLIISKHHRTLAILDIRRKPFKQFPLTQSVEKLPRDNIQSNLESDEYCKSDNGQEVAGEVIVTGVDPPEVLDAAEGIVDEMPIPIKRFVIDDLRFRLIRPGMTGMRPLRRRFAWMILAS